MTKSAHSSRSTWYWWVSFVSSARRVKPRWTRSHHRGLDDELQTKCHLSFSVSSISDKDRESVCPSSITLVHWHQAFPWVDLNDACPKYLMRRKCQAVLAWSQRKDTLQIFVFLPWQRNDLSEENEYSLSIDGFSSPLFDEMEYEEDNHEKRDYLSEFASARRRSQERERERERGKERENSSSTFSHLHWWK